MAQPEQRLTTLRDRWGGRAVNSPLVDLADRLLVLNPTPAFPLQDITEEDVAFYNEAVRRLSEREFLLSSFPGSGPASFMRSIRVELNEFTPGVGVLFSLICNSYGQHLEFQTIDNLALIEIRQRINVVNGQAVRVATQITPLF